MTKNTVDQTVLLEDVKSLNNLNLINKMPRTKLRTSKASTEPRYLRQFKGKGAMERRNDYFDSNTKHDYFRFAIDSENGGGKNYSGTYDIESFINFRNSTQSQKCFYEQTGRNKRIKMIFDIDLYSDIITQDIEKELITNFVNTLTEYIKTEEKFDDPNILLSKTSQDKNNSRKISFHVIVSNLYFKSSKDHKNWATKFQKKTNCNIDLSVYSNNQPFRIIGCHKFNQPHRVLKPYFINDEVEIDEKLYFMTYFTGNETLLEVEAPLKKNIERVVSSITFENEVEILLSLIHDMVSKQTHSLCDEEIPNKLNYNNWRAIAFSLISVNSFKPYENNDNDTQLWELICDLYRHFNGNYESQYFHMKNYDYSQFWNLQYLHKIAQEHNDYKSKFEIKKTIHLDNINPDEVINLNNVGSYINKLEQNDLLFIRSNMMTYKTQNLKELCSSGDYQKILYITFRCTLASAIEAEFQSFGFENYSKCKTTNGFFQNYPRLIVQIDSLHKVIGEYDLIVLDEFVYSRAHLHSFVKEKNNCFNTLIQYIKQDSVKIIVMDALLDNDTIDFFKSYNKKTYILENKWVSFSGKEFEIFDNNEKPFSVSEIVLKIKKYLDEGKNVYFPTSSKAMGDKIYRFFKDNFRVGYANCDEYIPKEEWGQFQLFITTPTNAAGVSFNDIHFDKCIAYCVNASCSAEIFSQMLFRVRNVDDPCITIFYKGSPKHGILSASKKRLDEWYSKRENIDLHLKFELHNPTGQIIKNNYYRDFINYKAKENFGYWNFVPVLRGILIAHGIRERGSLEELKANVEIEEFIYTETKKAKKDEREEICKQPIISDQEYDRISKKIRKTKDDKQKIRKRNMVNTYGKSDFNEDFLKKFEPVQEQYKNLKIVHEGELENYVKRNMERVNSKDDDIAMIHEKYRFLKPLFATELLQIIGFNSPFDIEKVIKEEDFPIDRLEKYLSGKFREIDFIFNIDQKKEKQKSGDFKVAMKIEDILDDGKGLTFFNKIFRQAFNISVGQKCKTTGFISYCIKGYDKWDEIKDFSEKIVIKECSLLERPFTYVREVDFKVGIPKM